ncbi:hypothetical protein [Xanthomonas medicagonis]|uniref:hypothetical protein n=1 Tax=Xanthomonas medicagonis TaxID=3160841 RepID=UPI0035146933
MNINQIHLLASQLPTIMDLDDEIRLIENLTMIGPREIAGHQDEFRCVVLKLQESHQGGGVFEVTEENYPVFEGFCDWLQSLQPHLEFDVSCLCDGLNVSPGAIRASMGTGRNRMP